MTGMPNCYECVFPGHREDSSVAAFCERCLQAPGLRKWCLAYEDADGLRPFIASRASSQWPRPVADRSECDWFFLEWSSNRRGYRVVGAWSSSGELRGGTDEGEGQ